MFIPLKLAKIFMGTKKKVKMSVIFTYLPTKYVMTLKLLIEKYLLYNPFICMCVKLHAYLYETTWYNIHFNAKILYYIYSFTSLQCISSLSILSTKEKVLQYQYSRFILRFYDGFHHFNSIQNFVWKQKAL